MGARQLGAGDLGLHRLRRRRHRHRDGYPLGAGLRRDLELRGRRHLRPDLLGDRVHRRHRLLRLLVGLPDRLAHVGAGGSLRPRRVQLARLLQGQHRPQGDRHPVPGADLHLLHDRWRAGRGRPRRAGAAGDAVRLAGRLQRTVLGACDADDLPVHHPVVRRPGELRGAADAGRPGHGVPAAERAVLLAVAARRPDLSDVVRRGRVRRRLDELRAAVGAEPARGHVLHDRRAVRRCVRQLPRLSTSS